MSSTERLTCPIQVGHAGFVEGKVVERGEYGVLVPVGNAQALADAMLEMMDSSELQSMYKQKGYERVKGCDMEVVLGQIRPIMYELLGREIVVDKLDMAFSIKSFFKSTPILRNIYSLAANFVGTQRLVKKVRDRE